MKRTFMGLFVIVAVTALAFFALGPSESSAKKKKGEPAYRLTIGADQELTFPADLIECKVFNSDTLEQAVLKATWFGECEWIVLRPGTDLSSAAFAIQLEKPLVIADMDPKAKGHPVVITNDTGRQVFFKPPKNGGCSIIIGKPDVAVMGFTFEGAVCR